MKTIDYLISTLGEVHWITPGVEVYAVAALTLLLLAFSGFASASEIAFFNLSPTDLNALDPEHNAADRKIETLRNDSERTLATILITNNLVNVTIIMLCNYIFANMVDFGKAIWLHFLCITVLLTFLLLLFGEIMPKVYARQNSLNYCRFSAGTLMFLRKLFWQVENLLMGSASLAGKIVHKEAHVLSVDDLEQALELTDKEELKEEKSEIDSKINPSRAVGPNGESSTRQNADFMPNLPNYSGEEPGRAVAMRGMILSICSVVLALICNFFAGAPVAANIINIVALICGIGGIVFGVMGGNQNISYNLYFINAPATGLAWRNCRRSMWIKVSGTWMMYCVRPGCLKRSPTKTGCTVRTIIMWETCTLRRAAIRSCRSQTGRKQSKCICFSAGAFQYGRHVRRLQAEGHRHHRIRLIHRHLHVPLARRTIQPTGLFVGSQRSLTFFGRLIGKPNFAHFHGYFSLALC